MMHDQDTLLLKEGKKPIDPYYCDWKLRLLYPRPIFVSEREDVTDVLSSSHVDTEEMEGA